MRSGLGRSLGSRTLNDSDAIINAVLMRHKCRARRGPPLRGPDCSTRTSPALPISAIVAKMKAGIANPMLLPRPSAPIPTDSIDTHTARATSSRPASSQRKPGRVGVTVVNAVITRYVVSNPAGTLTEAAGPHTIAIATPSIAIVTIEYTNNFPLVRCTPPPFAA